METNESAVDYSPLHVRNLRDARRAPQMPAVLVRQLLSLGGPPPLPCLGFFARSARPTSCQWKASRTPLVDPRTQKHTPVGKGPRGMTGIPG